MERKEYNGWTNYETWLIKLWMDNDEGSYNYWKERTEGLTGKGRTYDLAESLKAFHEEMVEEALGNLENGFIVDLLNGAMGEVNWFEIAEHLVEENKVNA